MPSSYHSSTQHETFRIPSISPIQQKLTGRERMTKPKRQCKRWKRAQDAYSRKPTRNNPQAKRSETPPKTSRNFTTTTSHPYKRCTRKARSGRSATATPGPRTRVSASSCARTPPPSRPGCCTGWRGWRRRASRGASSRSTGSSATRPWTPPTWPSSTRWRE